MSEAYVKSERGNGLRLMGDPSGWSADGEGLEIQRLVLTPHASCLKPALSFVEGPRLFVGPWIGEFGWELMRWQGGIRKIAQQYEGSHRTIVFSDPGHEVLYEYAAEFWSAPELLAESGFVRQCDHVRSGPEAGRLLCRLAAALGRALHPWTEADRIVLPRRFRPHEQVFKRLSAAMPRRLRAMRGQYFCFFPRRRPWGSDKNWPQQNWTQLISELDRRCELNAIAIGTEQEVAPFGTDAICADRNLGLAIAALREAHFAVCSEGGGIFLALLCGTPTVAFGHEKWRGRVSETENPLGTQVVYTGRPDHAHTVEEVLDAAQEVSSC